MTLVVSPFRADPDLHIGVLLNARAPVELGDCVTAIDECHGVELGMPFDELQRPPDLSHIPREWDFVIRGHDHDSGWPALDQVRRILKDWIHARHPDAGWNAPFLPRRRPRGLRLALPEEARRIADAWLRKEHSPYISVLPAAGGYMKAPSVEFWARLLTGIAERFPRAGFVLLGSTDPSRSASQGFGPRHVAELIRRVPGARDSFDLGLLQQLAIAERCALHVSPHSGMSFAVQAVGVPWLVISAHRWPEYLLGDTAIHSILPECPLYPCHGRQIDECGRLEARSERVLCMQDAALLGKVEEAIDAADRLLRGDITFQESAERNVRLLRARLGPGEDEDPLYGWGVPTS